MWIAVGRDEEHFGDVTVNLSVAAPNYCGYLNVNDMPDIEKFITDNDIGEFRFPL